MLRTPNPIIVVDLFPELLDYLLSLLRGLEEDEWKRSTTCEGWSVKDVALHLLGVEIGNLSSRRDKHSIGGFIDNWEELVDFINQMNQGWIQVSRRMSTPLLIDLLELTGYQICDYFRSLDPYAMGGAISWVGPEPVPVWLDMAREYTERWHHQQHIRDAVEQPGLKQPKYLAPVIATFARGLPRTFRDLRVEEDIVVTLTVTGKSGGQWSIRREGGGWEFYEGSSDRADSEVVLFEDVAWRLFTHGLTKTQAIEHATLIGDKELGIKLLEMISILA
jgi:uncharacterized protein (TIGR03083 family)